MNKPEELRKIKEDMENDKSLPLVKKPEDIIQNYQDSYRDF